MDSSDAGETKEGSWSGGGQYNQTEDSFIWICKLHNQMTDLRRKRQEVSKMRSDITLRVQAATTFPNQLLLHSLQLVLVMSSIADLNRPSQLAETSMSSSLSPTDLRHITSSSNLASPTRERKLSNRNSQHLRTHRVGSRSPSSIPSSPTSV